METEINVISKKKKEEKKKKKKTTTIKINQLPQSNFLSVVQLCATSAFELSGLFNALTLLNQRSP